MNREGREIYLILRTFTLCDSINGDRDSIHPYLSYDSQFIYKLYQSKHAITKQVYKGDYFKVMFNNRSQWILAYFRDYFFADMSIH
jgi:hypothetical protein